MKARQWDSTCLLYNRSREVAPRGDDPLDLVVVQRSFKSGCSQEARPVQLPCFSPACNVLHIYASQIPIPLPTRVSVGRDDYCASGGTNERLREGHLRAIGMSGRDSDSPLFNVSLSFRQVASL